MLLEKVEKTIKKNQLINPSDKIIIGVSGGPDSVCLLHVLYQLRKEYDLKLIIAHINYGYRGEEANQDEKYVEELAKSWQLPCFTKKPFGKVKTSGGVLDRSSRSSQKAGNLEADFRVIRYRFFTNLLEKERANKIAVAHNQNDQVETILMFFLRGSGLKGLSGMDYQQGKVIRPLLDCSRQDILNYLQEHKLKFRQDKTNEDLSFTRNRIRCQLIPYLQKEFNPNLLTTLTQEAKILRDDCDFMESVVEKTYKFLAGKKGNKIIIDWQKFQQSTVALQRGILRQAFVNFSGNTRNISFLDLEEALRVLREGKSGSYRDIKGLRIAKKNGKIIISTNNL